MSEIEFIRKRKELSPDLRYSYMEDGELFPMLYFHNIENTGIVRHGFTTRLGGVSKGIYAQLNLSFTRGDRHEDVEENFRRTAQALNVEYENFVFTDQTHTANVRRITRKDAGKGLVRERDYQDVDGLVTNEPGLVLSTFFADCVPLYFVDPVNRAIGMSHSGWRGTVRRMGKQTAQVMAREFGSRPEDLICAVGPSICQDCYEVSEDVAEAFQKEFPEHKEKILISKGNGKYQLDLWKANEIVLLEAGIRPEHLEVTDICTCCNPRLLFSHRASHGKRGNLGAFLCLKEISE